jgi:hypothetical protein
VTPDSRAVILVEGTSDQAALEALAERHGRNLAAERISIEPMGGATNIGRFLRRLETHGLGLRLAGLRLAGLCDAGAEGHFRRALERAGFGPAASRADLEALGFYVCVADLEDELIRALGVTEVEQVIEAQGELRSLRIMQRQPAQRRQSPQQQLHRFMGTHSGRKSLYARLLVGALDLDRVPRPLDRVLAHVTDGTSR